MGSIEYTPEKGEECGVAGAYFPSGNVAPLVLSMIRGLQHRGQEGAGAGFSDGETLFHRAKPGLVSQVFREDRHGALNGHIGIAHTRYATSGGKQARYVQPVFLPEDGIMSSHNGHFPDTTRISRYLMRSGIDPEGLSDSQMLTHAIAVKYRRKMKLDQAFQKTFPLLAGAFSVLLMDRRSLVASRDRYGIRPLSIGELGDGYVFASETCVFRPIGARHVRDVMPGEMVVADEKGLRSVQLTEGEQRLDIFEFIYFARPDSVLLGKVVNDVRENLGSELACEDDVEADIVVGVPQSGMPAAYGYAQRSGMPLKLAILKNRSYRTFIDANPDIQKFGIRAKLSVVPHSVEGKRVVVVDDSIVRGNNSAQIVAMLREEGAREVHFRSSCPPIKYPDFYGIDLPSQEELIAFGKTEKEVAEAIGADSVRYLSYDGMIRATGLPESSFSTACFTGEYPLDIGREREGIVGLPRQD